MAALAGRHHLRESCLGKCDVTLQAARRFSPRTVNKRGHQCGLGDEQYLHP